MRGVFHTVVYSLVSRSQLLPYIDITNGFQVQKYNFLIRTDAELVKQTMDYLRTNIRYENVQKVTGQAEANRFWNYPYDALEEAVVNSLCHL